MLNIHWHRVGEIEIPSPFACLAAGFTTGCRTSESDAVLKDAAAFGVRRQTLRSLGAAGAPSPLWIVDHVPATGGREYLDKSGLRPRLPGFEDPVAWQAKAAMAPLRG